ncbi:integral membrane protein-like protein [Rhexocercosporidium sp. MPI-PUGE-AT-0058]|nr:integral membrane protein-like protein [Rhexocercosporidium sp. MPI-PUGE-AT-0058]
MEKSKSCNIQALILYPHGDHGRHSKPDGTITMSADSREAGQDPWDGNGFANAPLEIRETSRLIRTGGRDNMAIRVQRRGSIAMLPFLLALIASLCIVPASAVLIDFQNCLSDAAKNNQPLQLQFVPLFVDAIFNTTDPKQQLAVTVWGNITGSTVGDAPRLVVPPGNDTDYWNGNSTFNGGKIVDSPYPDAAVPKLTTLSNKVNILTYEPWSEDVDFCNLLINASCPLGPRFFVNETDRHSYPAFQLKNNSFSTYSFTSIAATLLIKYGDQAATPIGCTSAVITPDLGSTLSSVLTYVPAVILIMVAIATAFAAIYSPWGTTDTFRWTTNYGRDADLLRLVTPGFGDCLQYIQFIVLTGGLTLSYPGFYQPIVSKASWSTLMFSESFVRNTTSNHGLVDGIYVVHGTYGLDKLRQLVGLSGVDDVWTGMTVWLLVILAVVLVLIQIGFFIRWAYRHLSDTPEEDLRAKNMPFSMGNVIRIVFNYFLLPIVALSMFQLVVASKSPSYTVALAVVMLVLIIGFAIWLLYVIASTRPKSYLFDDLPTVLLYGSLYNTYSDNAAPFALIPITLTFVRGVVIGAVQPSGIAQIVILAICEVITLLTLHAFRPFHSPTSMNAFHTVFSAVRFTTILLMVAFAPSLGVTEGPKGWIGYTILLMHALVLIFGFFLNAMQTIIEVAARMAGAGGDESGAARGGLVKVFGMRQLSKRMPRRDATSRQSQLSSAAMLDMENERKSYVLGDGRNRSQSAGSTILLNRQSTGLDFNVEPFGAIPPQQVGGSGGNSSYAATTPREASSFSFLPSAAAPPGRRPILGLATAEASDPYYRPPRLRRPTLEAYSPAAKSRGSWASGDWANKTFSSPEAETPDAVDEGPSISGRNTPTAPPGAALDGSPSDPRRSQADYTTREVDFYYGVRGPALNANIPSRRIKTGPADPTGIPASAAGWFKGFFGGKTKEKGKGFEVVRSSRMPPGMQARNAPGQETPPEGIPVATAGVVRSGPIDSDDDEPVHKGSSNTTVPPQPEGTLVEPLRSDEETEDEYSDDDFEITRISDIPPNLSGLDIPGGGIELPSRFPSKATSKASSRRTKTSNVPLVPGMPSRLPSNKPSVPRKSSRRKSQSIDLTRPGADFLPQHRAQQSLDVGGSSSQAPFDRSNSNKRHSDISSISSATGPSGFGHTRDGSSVLGKFSEDLSDDRPTSMGYVNQHSIRTITPSENQQYLGHSAEVVDGRISGASSMDHSRQ